MQILHDRRAIERVRQQHLKLNLSVLEQGISSNGPHIDELKAAKMYFLLGPKPCDHEHLVEQVVEAMDRDEPRVKLARVQHGKTRYDVRAQRVEELELNKSNVEGKVNFPHSSSSF